MKGTGVKKTLNLGKFDATLNTDACSEYDNAELTITLKLGFRQINPAGNAATGTYNDYGSASGTPRAIVKWSPGDWAVWKNNFCASAQRFWHGKFWLVNGRGAFGYKVGATDFIPNIWCRFELLGSDASAGTHHHVIDVVRLASSENWFGSHSTLYDSKDTLSVQKATDSAGKPIMQRAHVHEIGHVIGLPHVDVGKVHCPTTGNTNAASCYGVNDHDKNSVMGSGMRLDPEHAKPWIEAIEAHVIAAEPIPLLAAVASPISAILKPFTPKMSRHYPRTKAEYDAGKLITTRIKR